MLDQWAPPLSALPSLPSWSCAPMQPRSTLDTSYNLPPIHRPLHPIQNVLPPIQTLDPVPPHVHPPPPRSESSISTHYQPIEVDSLPTPASLVDIQPPPSAPPTLSFGHSHPPTGLLLAQKICEMVCYLWFSSSIASPSRSSRRRTAATTSPFPVGNASTAPLQFTPTREFVAFVHKLLETTQVSHSVIALSLHYLYKLKQRNMYAPGSTGSEFRIAVASFMMANKFVDDNTYTNKTWAEVSNINLNEVNRMEREFLIGVNYQLYVNHSTYASWLNLLDGLVKAMERDNRQWQYWRKQTAPTVLPLPSRVTVNTYTPPRPKRSVTSSTSQSQRARSSSPLTSLRTPYQFTFAPPPAPNPFAQRAEPSQQPSPPRSGSKRTANDAFSPVGSASQLPNKRRPLSIDLGQPAASSEPRYDVPVTAPTSHVQPIPSFSDLSLGTPDGSTAPMAPQQQTLRAPFRHERPPANHQPPTLVYYALASTPVETDGPRARKGYVRSYQPPSYNPPPIVQQLLTTQSASASPRDFMYMSSQLPTDFSHFQLEQPVYAHYVPPNNNSVPHHVIHRGNESVPVSAAPFANAGPPGVHWNGAPRSHNGSLRQHQQQQHYHSNWSPQEMRGRRM